MPAPTHRSIRLLMLAAAFCGAGALATAPAGASTSSTGKAVVKGKSAKQSKRSARPDLVARGLQLDFLSDGFTIKATIANTGSRSARGNDVSIALSTDKILDDEDEILEDVTIPRVQPGVQRSIATEVEIPAELPEGDLFLLVCADGNQDVKERSEGNNCTSQLVASAQDAVAPDDEEQDESSDQGDAAEVEEQDTVVGDLPE